MPIFNVNGKRYKVREEDIAKFATDYPDAYTVIEDQGVRYGVKPADYKAFITPKGTTHSPTASHAPEDFLDADLRDPAQVEQKQLEEREAEFKRDINRFGVDNIPSIKQPQQPTPVEQPQKTDEFGAPVGTTHTPTSSHAPLESFIDEDLRKLSYEQELADMSATREQVAGMQDFVQGKINDNRSLGDFVPGQMGMLMTMSRANTKRRKDLDAYSAANDALRNAQRIIDEADRNGADGSGNETSFVGGALRGFGQKVFDPTTWDMGLSEMANSGTLLEALDVADSGGELTEAQRTLLDAKAVEMATNAYFGSYLGYGYKAGQVSAESIPFMLEMAINPAAALGKGASAKLTRYALKRYGKEAIRKNAAKYLATKAATRVGADVVGAATMTATTGALGTTADALRRMSGDIEYDLDENGRPIYGGHTEGDDALRAWYEAIMAGTIERASEMAGGYIAPIGKYTGLSKLGGDVVRKITPNGVLNAIDNMSYNDAVQFITNLERKAQWNGVVGEFGEEIYGGILNSYLVGDQTRDTDENTGIFNRENLIETFLGVGLMGGFFSTVKTGAYAVEYPRAKRRLKRADVDAINAFGSADLWGTVKEQLASTDAKTRGKAVRDILADANLTPEQKKAAVTYVGELQRMDGVRIGLLKHQIDAATPAEEVEVEQSFENGYTLQTPQEKNDARTMLEEQRKRVIEIMHLPEDTDLDEYLGDDPLRTILMMEEGTTQGERQALLDYVNAASTVEGMFQAVRDDIDDKIAQSDAQVDSRISQTDGRIHPATMKQDNRAVYIMSGEVVLLDDGTIDTTKSSESIIVKDAETGKMEFSNPASLLNVGEVEDAEQTKEALREQIRQSVAGQAEVEILGTLAFAQGDTYVLTDEEGVQHQAKIVADNGDGTVQVALDGATEAVQMPKEQVQAMNDATNRGRAAAYIEQQNAQRESAMQEVAEEQQPIEEQPIEQPQEPQVEESALSRIPTDENGNQLFEQAPAQDTWSALVELNEGDTTEATDTAQQMLDNAKKELDKATSVKPKGGATVAEIQQDKAERKARIAEAQQKVDYWAEVLNAQQAVQEQAAQEVAQAEEVAPVVEETQGAETLPQNNDAEKIALQQKIQEWLTPENISWAEGKELKDSVEKFGNNIEPIAVLPQIIKKFFPEISSLYLYSGKGYLIDHAANHHPELAAEEYDKIQEVVDSYDDIKDLSTPSSKKIAFVKMLDKGFAVVTELAEKDGKIMLHKTFFYRGAEGKREPYKNRPSLLKKASVDGSTTISPANEAAGRHRKISALDALSDSKDTTSEPKNQEVEREIPQEEQIAPQEVAGQTQPATEPTAQETQAEAVPTQEQTEQEEQKQRKQQRVRIKVKKDEEARRKPLRKRAQAWAKKVGVEAVIIERFEDVENESARKAIQMHEEQKSGQRIPGWYSGGKVYIYLPHATDISDLDQTYIHEVVAHHGMKQMLGEEGYKQFCLKVWDMMEQTLNERELNRWLAYQGVKGDKAKAADEYIAHLAETTESLTELDQSVWDKIVELLRDALRQLGVTLEGDAVAFDPSVEFTNKLIIDALHASKRNLKQGAKTATTKEKAKAATPKAQKVSDPKIEDFGEKIGGARKDVARGRLRDTAKLSMKDLTTLKDPDKILSRKDIVKFMQEGLMTEQDAMTLMALNAAARSKWTVRKGQILQKYRDVALQWERGEQVKVEVTDAEIDAYLAGMNESWRSQPNARKKAQADLLHSILVPFEAYHSTYEKLNYPSVYRNLKGTVIKEYHSGKYFVQSELGARRGMVFNSLQQAIDYVEKAYPVVSTELSKPKSGKADSSEKVGHLHVVKDSLYGYRIKSRSIPGNIFLSGRFRTKADAEAYLQENAETLRSREEQMIFTLMGSDIGAVERSGVDYRQGRDITPEEFQSTFGFRGVEFGNWVPQAERQLYLNKTYDAIMDFCKVVGISPKAFSLGGQLALAFGSRGKSKAIAHYEPMKMAINLTRMNGAGSLAHEWFHALDNYLARQATGNALDMATDKRRAERDIVANTFSQLVRRMATLDYSTRSRNAGAYWNEVWERAARLFESYVYNELGGQQTMSPLLVRETTLFDDTLVENFGQAYPYPSAEENAIMKPYFDALFGALEERIDEQGNSILFRTVENDKARQFAIIERSNPMLDDYHTGIRSVEDIRTFDEAVAEARTAAEQGGWEELASYPDITNDMLEEAQQSGRITIYSSKPIANGTFVTPSLMQASDYAGGEEVYSKVVRTSDVAWINTDEGQMAASEDVRFRTTYHGTPATFERFDHSFMGSGEGNRVFGWGTYVTEEKGIGEWYAKVLTDPINEFSPERRAIIDAKIELDKVERFAESLREEIQYAKDNIAFFEERIRNGATGYELEEAQENIENSKENISYNEQALTNAEATIESARAAVAQAQEIYERARVRGNVYQVEIPDDNGHNYLSWEDRLTPKQMQMIASQAEKEGLTDILYRDEDSGELVFNGSITSGEREYKDLVRSLGSDKAASEFLSRAGFTGIKYFGDGGNQDVHNYVIFNDADLEIKDRTSFRTVPTFLSNAAVALEGIKQEKATPQQWLAMLKKAGGIKAGEDKWIGLSEWLEQSEAKTLTKQEVADFINENQIQIEEVAYGDGGKLRNTSHLNWVTKGLKSYREIALTVPTIESWNEGDLVHFGDAGEGRAIAWIRFGETTDSDGKRVLVIDEIQSQRHQEGREKGYRPSDVDKYLKDNNVEVVETGEFYEFYRDGELDRRFSKGLLHYNIKEAKNLYVAGYEKSGIPEAPFEKNWAELAMKRMLRYAAEHGFDKVAWTKGDQQSMRYGLADKISKIHVYKHLSGNKVISLDYRNRTEGIDDYYQMSVDENGKITQGDFVGRDLSEVVGKDLAVKLMSVEDRQTFSGDGLVVGNEGMRAFYDQMLPSFMRKYAKKWGATVQDVTLPNVEEAGRTMHSVDVTESMRESVMQGQTMFRVADPNRYMFIGEQGARQLDAVEEATTRLDNLEVAKEMEAANKGPRTIKMATGWERGADGKWRYETLDGIDTQAIANITEGEYTLEDFVLDESLFDAYPSLRGVKVIVEPNTGQDYGGYWDSANNTIALVNYNDGGKYEQSSIIHEIQHAIQRKEGFTSGINPKSEMPISEEKRSQIEALRSAIRYTQHFGDVNLASLIHDDKKYGGYIWNTLSQETKDILTQLAYGRKKMSPKEAYIVLNARWDKLIQKELVGEGRYRRQAGEVEARNSAARRGMGLEERRAFLASETEDVAREDQLFIYDNIGSKNTIGQTAQMLGQDLATRVNLVERIEDITDPNPKIQERKRKARGWYDTESGEVFVVLPNVKSGQEARRTVFHEVVGHKGMRETVGEKRYNAFLEKVYRGASQTIRERIARRAATLGWDFNLATDEYLASLAEQGFEERENRNFFEVVRDLFLDLLSDAKIALGYRINDNDIRYMLWRTYQMQRSKGAMGIAEDMVMQQKLGVGNFAPNDTRFRVTENGSLTKRVSDIMEEYDDSEEIFTIGDVADRIEELLNEYDGHESTTTLEDILNDYRDAQSEANRYGHRWDSGGEEAFEDAIRLFASRQANPSDDVRMRETEAPSKQRANYNDPAYIQEQIDKLKSYAWKAKQTKTFRRELANLIAGRMRALVGRELAEQMGVSEFNALTRQMANATVSQDVIKPLERIEEIVANLAIKKADASLKRLLEMKIQGENKTGVSVAKTVDDATRQVVEYVKANMGTPTAELLERVNERIEDGDQEKAVVELAGIDILRMIEGVQSIDRDIAEINEQIQVLREANTTARNMRTMYNQDGKAAEAQEQTDVIAENNELISALESERVAKTKSKLQQLNAVVGALQSAISKGQGAYQSFVAENIRQNAEMIEEALMDIDTGKTLEMYDRPKKGLKKAWVKSIEFLISPANSLLHLIRKISVNAPNGEGYLFDTFIRGKNGYIEASNRYKDGVKSFVQALDEAAKRYIGKSYADVLEESSKSSGYIAHLKQSKKRTDEKELTIGEALYIYMVSKMADGKVKLLKMGIKEEFINEMAEALPNGYIQFADWVQEEFLPQRRKAYNDTHTRVFGTQMAEIEHYIPLRVRKDETFQEVDGSKDEDRLPTTMTGSIINRRRNNVILDVNTNVFDLLLNHGQEMEHWNAYTPVVKAMNALLSNTRIRLILNQRQDGLHTMLQEAAQVASDQFVSRANIVSKALIALSTGMASSKINFRVWTAMKQILGFPAFLTYSSDTKFFTALAKNIKELAVPKKGGVSTWEWGIQNLPSLRERWESRNLGNERLAYGSGIDIFDKMTSTTSYYGMMPNAFVDMLACTVGAKAVYDYKYEAYKKEGYSDEEADRLAKIDATLMFNETQQSAESLFLSPLQRSRDYTSAAFNLFRNANFGYLRKMLDGIYELRRDKANETEFLEQMYLRKGFNADEARRLAELNVSKTKMKAKADIAMFGFILNILWVAGGNILPDIFLSGDDDDEEKSMLRQVAELLIMSPLTNTIVGPAVESLMEGYDFNIGALTGTINQMKDRIQQGEAKKWDQTAAYLVLRNLVSSATGADIDVAARMYEGIDGAIKDGVDTEDVLSVLNTPVSQTRAIASEPHEGETIDAYLKRMADVERRIDSKVSNSQTNRWIKNFYNYRLSDALDRPYVRDRYGRVTIPVLNEYKAIVANIEEEYKAAIEKGFEAEVDFVNQPRYEQMEFIKEYLDIIDDAHKVLRNPEADEDIKAEMEKEMLQAAQELIKMGEVE